MPGIPRIFAAIVFSYALWFGGAVHQFRFAGLQGLAMAMGGAAWNFKFILAAMVLLGVGVKDICRGFSPVKSGGPRVVGYHPGN